MNTKNGHSSNQVSAENSSVPPDSSCDHTGRPLCPPSPPQAQTHTCQPSRRVLPPPSCGPKQHHTWTHHTPMT